MGLNRDDNDGDADDAGFGVAANADGVAAAAAGPGLVAIDTAAEVDMHNHKGSCLRHEQESCDVAEQRRHL